MGKPEPCHVFLAMRNSAAPSQSMVMNFRYLTGLSSPELAVIYTTFGQQHMIFDPSGRMHDLTRKEKWQGGFYTDPSHAPPAEKLRAEHEKDPIVDVTIGAASFHLRTMICIRGRCIARDTLANVPNVQAGTKITVGLPGPNGSQSFNVVIPSDGLDQALTELSRAKSS